VKCRTCNGLGILWKQKIIGGPDEAKVCHNCSTEHVEQTITYKDGALIWRISGTWGASPNETKRGNWRTGQKDRDRWRALIGLLGNPEMPGAVGPFKLFVREWPKVGCRHRDMDNIAASVKWPLDALVQAGYLAIDSQRVVQGYEVLPPGPRPPWCAGKGLEITLAPLPCPTPDPSSSVRAAVGSK